MNDRNCKNKRKSFINIDAMIEFVDTETMSIFKNKHTIFSVSFYSLLPAPDILCSYEGQSLVVNEIFPPCEFESDDDDDDDRYDRSDASRTADEDATSNDSDNENEIQFTIDDLSHTARSGGVIQID